MHTEMITECLHQNRGGCDYNDKLRALDPGDQGCADHLVLFILFNRTDIFFSCKGETEG